MDGLKPTSNVVVMAATNRPGVIEPALRRFGRFDRELDIGVPDEGGRIEIMKIKTRNMKLDPDVDLEQLGKDTHGYVGADLAQLCLEAGLETIRDQAPDMDMGADRIESKVLDSLKVDRGHFGVAMKRCSPSALRETNVRTSLLPSLLALPHGSLLFFARLPRRAASTPPLTRLRAAR